MPNFTIGDASGSDIDGLLDLEEASFETDRISRRSYRRLVRSPSASLRVARSGRAIAGYALVLNRATSTVARLYSLAIDRRWRGVGLAGALIADAERIARRCGANRLRLEVRKDNLPAIRLYERLGFRRIGTKAGYYADGATAVRYEKRLPRRAARSPRPLRSGASVPAG